MARIAGVNIPKEKRLVIALTYIYGIGPTTANRICKKVGVDLKTRTHQVSEDVLAKLRAYIEKEKMTLEGDLRRKVSADIKRLVDLGCYRGIRHVKKLPVRGQRTHTNAKTRKGRGVAIANKKKAVK
ncbi:MAG: 30S ribosomal protein S13 [Rickettsiales bacterium]|nr:30S ribosomal protein S13 [Rickettsiales bacterium]